MATLKRRIPARCTSSRHDFIKNARIKKVGLFVAIIAAHILLLLWVAQEQTFVRHARRSNDLLIIALPKTAQAMQRVPPPVPIPVLEPILPTPADHPPTSPVSVAVSTVPGIPADTACDLGDSVQSALRASKLVRQALDNLPNSSKSVANALMVWDGQWVSANTPYQARAFAVIQSVIVETVIGAPEQCRNEPQSGPRLAILPGFPDTVIAMGSGTWRWGALIAVPPSSLPLPNN